jgi:hypothetical protein
MLVMLTMGAAAFLLVKLRRNAVFACGAVLILELICSIGQLLMIWSDHFSPILLWTKIFLFAYASVALAILLYVRWLQKSGLLT